MKAWQDDCLDKFEKVGNQQDLLHAMVSSARDLEFDFCTVATRVPAPLAAPSVHVTTSYSASWQNRYLENNYLVCDPVVLQSLRTRSPFTWDESFFSDSKEFYEDASSEGIRFGWTHSVHGPNNTISLVSLARSAEAISTRELKDKQCELAWFTQTVQICVARHLLPKLIPLIEVKLSSREISVLRWIAEGKSSNDIAEILRISKRTVDLHANNSVAKLGAPNRTAAAVMAAMHGLL